MTDRAGALPAPGMPCPECGTRIVIDMQQLLTQDKFSCPGCRLELTLNREESAGALDALKGFMNDFDQVKQKVEAEVDAATGETAVTHGKRVPKRRSRRQPRGAAKSGGTG